MRVDHRINTPDLLNTTGDIVTILRMCTRTNTYLVRYDLRGT
jgi:hypothetical protein